jgi:hypothetical protein
MRIKYSKCCHAPVELIGGDWEMEKMIYVCTKCGDPAKIYRRPLKSRKASRRGGAVKIH